jgi:hypothetical protein
MLPIGNNPAYQKWVEQQGGVEKAQNVANIAALKGTKIHLEISNAYKKQNYRFSNPITIPESPHEDLSPWVNNLYTFLRKLEVIEESYQLAYSQQSQFAGELDLLLTGLRRLSFFTDKSLINKTLLADGELTVADIKTRSKPKRREHLLRYALQLGAYSLAWNSFQDRKIDSGLIIVSCPELHLYYLDNLDLEFYQKEFLKGVRAFSNKEEYSRETLIKDVGLIEYDKYTKIIPNNKLPRRLYTAAL